MTGRILVSSLLLVAGALAQDQPAKQRTGLEAQLISLGVTHERYPYLAAAVKLTNNSPAYLFVLLFGAPLAVDDAGGSFIPLNNPVNGVAFCLGWAGTTGPNPRSCVSPTRGEEDFLFPVDQYTEIEPGQSANFNVRLRAIHGSEGSKYNLTQEIAYRVVKPDAIDQDQNRSAKDKLKALHFGSLNFSQTEAPLKEKVTSSITFDMSSIK